MQSVVISTPTYCCSAHNQTLQPSSSCLNPYKSSSFFRARVSVPGGRNPLRRSSWRCARVRSPGLPRRQIVKAVATPNSALELPLTAENVETYWMKFDHILLQMGEMWHYMRLTIPEIVAVEPVTDEETGLELNEENIEKVLEEIRPYLVGAAGGSLELVAIEEPIVKVRITGPAAGVMTVRVAVTQKLREKIPAVAAVQLL
ncbi:NifU-like protein 2 [Hibiscus syriacus]|uniref:NifU-like protein 2 n=1 Tax=Hibiscus syriacus TaxID=106335 RepID=A0A6A2Z6E5_HIBSY|nr:NifU-like protein 2 [Hibiscus syriacus]